MRTGLKKNNLRSTIEQHPSGYETGHTMLVALQHVLLWASAYVMGSELYLLFTSAISTDLLPVAIVLLVSGGVSLLYLILHWVTAFLTARIQTERIENARIGVQWLATVMLRLAVTAWLAACGLNITFILARQPYCISDHGSADERTTTVNVGVPCIVQRTGVGAGLMSLLASSALFVLVQKTSSPFRAHLFGVAREPSFLPLALPCNMSAERAMFSEMSFKCHSSASLSSHLLAPSRCGSTAHLLSVRPERAAVGLGIYAPKSSTPSYLTPRPSLSSIRSHTTISSLPPPSSPLPPMPAYFPDRYRGTSTIHKAIYPPRPARPYPYLSSQSVRQNDRTLRLVPSSPALSAANLAAFNRSTESVSSAYSRSESGERHSPLLTSSSDGSRSLSSGSTATVLKSPLGAMRRAEDPDVVVLPPLRRREDSRSETASEDSDIDDVEALQGKLPCVTKPANEFGAFHGWEGARETHGGCCHGAQEMGQSAAMRQAELVPLVVRKVRDSAALLRGQRARAHV